MALDDYDGEALELILTSGGTTDKGVITYDGNDSDVLAAISYLCAEWDYVRA